MNDTLMTLLTSAVASTLIAGAMGYVLAKTRNVTDIAVADINADVQDDISKRTALQEEQKRLNEQRAQLDEMREKMEKARTLEIGGLKLQIKTMQEAMADEQKRHAEEIQALKARVLELERELLKANILIVELQRGTAGDD